MIPELGHFALILALLASLAQAVLSMVGAAKSDEDFMQAGRGAALAVLALIFAAFAALIAVHMSDDFSVLNVAMNSHTQKPLLYKIAGAWASHEGSMLLWVLILAIFGAGLAFLQPAMPLVLRARAIAVQGMTGCGFLAFILFASNPFARLFPAPVEGAGLNPLLQDPALAFHPPFLYLGYVGFSSVFALAAAILLADADHAKLIKFLRPWVLAAWGALTFGIALGSWWAYYELGWGGFWFWDPVENAALLPWLAGTALLHSLVAAERRAALLRWTILLAILAFSLSLTGTFLVRSGVLTSVHSFALDPARGVFILGLIVLAIGSALTLYALRAHALPQSPFFEPVSRETAMLLNNLFLCTACATLFAGTLYPLLLQALGGGSISVGAPYFNAAVLPLLAPALVLMVIAPFIRWQQGDLSAALRQLRFAFAVALLAALLGLYFYGFKNVLGLLGLAAGAWIVAGTLADARRAEPIRPRLARLLAHGGLGIAVIGMAGSTFAEEHALSMKPHEVAQAGAYRIEFVALDGLQGPNYAFERGVFHIWRGEHFLATLAPEQRFYPVQGMELSHVAIHTDILRDLYLSLGAKEDDGSYALRFHINPLVPLIWIGAAIMALGGIAGAVQRRKT